MDRVWLRPDTGIPTRNKMDAGLRFTGQTAGCGALQCAIAVLLIDARAGTGNQAHRNYPSLFFNYAGGRCMATAMQLNKIKILLSWREEKTSFWAIQAHNIAQPEFWLTTTVWTRLQFFGIF